MIDFTYTAKDRSTGETVKSQVQAESEQAAAKLLMSRNLLPISIQNKDNSFASKLTRGHVAAKDRVLFTRQLATLINAGLPLDQALQTVQDQITSKQLLAAIRQTLTSIEGGSTLSAAFGQHPKIFNQVYVSLVAAGESSGSLDTTLERLAAQQEKEAEIASKIRSAMVYPAIVLVVILLVLVFMLTTVLPQVIQLYKDFNKPLPFFTSGLAALANFTTHFYWLELIVLLLAGFGIRTGLKTSRGRHIADQIKLNTPLFGKLMRKVYMARFARTLSTLMDSGIPVLHSLEIVKNAVNNSVIGSSFDRMIQEVRGGKALSESLRNDDNFLALVPQMIKIGERSGKIGEMLGRVATFYENEVDEEIKNLSATIEPVLMVVMGLIVAFIIAAIFFPIYTLVGNGSIQGGA